MLHTYGYFELFSFKTYFLILMHVFKFYCIFDLLALYWHLKSTIK